MGGAGWVGSERPFAEVFGKKLVAAWPLAVAGMPEPDYREMTASGVLRTSSVAVLKLRGPLDPAVRSVSFERVTHTVEGFVPRITSAAGRRIASSSWRPYHSSPS